MMQGYTITVRMEDREEPRVTVSARELYKNLQQGDVITATSTVEVSPDLSALQDILQAMLDDFREQAEEAATRGAIRSSAASLRAYERDEKLARSAATAPRATSRRRAE